MVEYLKNDAQRKSIGEIEQSKKEFCEEGVFFENLNLTVPWYMEVSDTAKYGNPKVTKIWVFNYIQPELLLTYLLQYNITTKA
jgi:hypothetical protein